MLVTTGVDHLNHFFVSVRDRFRVRLYLQIEADLLWSGFSPSSCKWRVPARARKLERKFQKCLRILEPCRLLGDLCGHFAHFAWRRTLVYHRADSESARQLLHTQRA